MSGVVGDPPRFERRAADACFQSRVAGWRRARGRIGFVRDVELA
jgi:hypothetical protein